MTNQDVVVKCSTTSITVTTHPATVIALSQVEEAVQHHPEIPENVKDAVVGFIWVEIGAILNEIGEQVLKLPPELQEYIGPITDVIKTLLGVIAT